MNEVALELRKIYWCHILFAVFRTFQPYLPLSVMIHYSSVHG